MGWSSYEEVELSLFTLRRSQSSFWPRWERSPPGLNAELLNFIARGGGAQKIERLLGVSSSSKNDRELVAAVCSSIEEGKIEVDLWTGGGSFAGSRQRETPLQELTAPSLVPSAAAEVEPAAPSAETPSTSAQADVLETAASSATPFCEVCENPAVRESASPEPAVLKPTKVDAVAREDEVAQLGALEAAADEGTPFCEVCTGT